MAHHRFDPVAAYERLVTFDPARLRRRDRRALQRDAQRLRRFIDVTSARLHEELDLWRRIAQARDAGREPTEQPTVDRLTELPGASEYVELLQRVDRRSPEGDVRVDEAA